MATAAAAPGDLTVVAWSTPAGSLIRIDLQRGGEVRLDAYDVAGRRARELVRAVYPAGSHAITWDGRDDEGHPLASGVYLLRLAGPGGTAAARVLRLR